MGFKISFSESLITGAELTTSNSLHLKYYMDMTLNSQFSCFHLSKKLDYFLKITEYPSLKSVYSRSLFNNH